MARQIKKVYIFLFLAALLSNTLLFSWSFPPPVRFPQNWKPNPGATTGKIEYKIIDDPKEAYKGDKYVYLKGHLAIDNVIDVYAGDKINISFYAKSDTGQPDVSTSLYAYQKNEYGGITYISTINVTSKKIGQEWTEVKGTIIIPETFREKRVNSVKVALISKTGVYFDYPQVEHIKTLQLLNFDDAYNQSAQNIIKGDFEAAVNLLNQALKLARTDTEKEKALKKIKDAEYRLGAENAIVNIKEIFSRADDYIKSGDYKNARSEYEKLNQLKGVDFLEYLALSNIAESYVLEKDYKKALKTYEKLLKLPDLKQFPYYKIYGLFRQAEVFTEQKDYTNARKVYTLITKRREALEQHILMANLFSADTYTKSKRYSTAKKIYEKMLLKEETKTFPNESYRRDIVDKLEAIKNLKDGQNLQSRQEKLIKRINSPKQSIYVSTNNGRDTNSGDKDTPFATITRAQEEVRKIKATKGLPKNGITVYLRAGKYFLDEGLIFEGEQDSGTEVAPIVYRSYPGEEVRIIGGKQLKQFEVLKDTNILKRLPEETLGKIWVCDLKKEGITDYGVLQNRGVTGIDSDISTTELFFNTKPMNLVRWPKEGWLRVFDLTTPYGDGKISSYNIQRGRFKYSDDIPLKWKEEKNIWTVGYFLYQWDKIHTEVLSIDTDNKIIHLSPDMRTSEKRKAGMPVRVDAPYHFYNILSELSVPGEFYIDSDTGKLYFYPPKKIDGDEIFISTIKTPIIQMNNVSNILFYQLTIEGTRQNGINIDNSNNNLVAGTTIRNTGVLGIMLDGGWNNSVIGCDIYDTGEGGIQIKNNGDRAKLIPSSNLVENNHIYRFNRFSHGGNRFGVTIVNGSGNRVSHNILSDTTYNSMTFAGNDNIIEYNEIYDVTNEARDGGAIYTYGLPFRFMSKGNIMRYNFIHHITQHSSPIKTHQVTGIYIDSINSGMTVEGNILYRNTERAMYVNGPDNRIENNLLIDNNIGITLNDRSWIFDHTRLNTLIPTAENHLRMFNFKQPPWSVRYPQMTIFFEDKLPLARNEKNSIERNINVETPPLSTHASVKMDKNILRNNWDDGDPLLFDINQLDMRLRPGSPAYGSIGCMPISFKKIGVYDSPLRASWPVNRLPVGKYYKEEFALQPSVVASSADKFQPLKKISETYQYNVKRRTTPINIDGKLEKNEWFDLDKTKALIVREKHTTGETREGTENYVWLSYDDKYLYIGIENMPDPIKQGVPATISASSSLNEFAIEGPFTQNIVDWWYDGAPTGPIYIFSGYPDGKFVVNKTLNIPASISKRLQTEIEYKANVINADLHHWSSEWKIPLGALELKFEDLDSVRFNIGGPKRDAWYAWVATGAQIWRVDNAGILQFIK
ncbi:right-handed parallel beta-helix repeat-containing protein [bacterium]|nr:right-handed parallel beta-helix repeat-containing protein [bacterium]